MVKRIAAGLVFVFVYFALSPFALAITPKGKGEKVRVGLMRLGAGEQTRVAVKLRNGTRLSGYISSIDDDSFTVSELGSTKNREIDYSDVAQIHANNITSRQKFIIGTVFIVGFLTILLLVAHAAR